MKFLVQLYDTPTFLHLMTSLNAILSLFSIQNEKGPVHNEQALCLGPDQM